MSQTIVKSGTVSRMTLDPSGTYNSILVERTTYFPSASYEEKSRWERSLENLAALGILWSESSSALLCHGCDSESLDSDVGVEECVHTWRSLSILLMVSQLSLIPCVDVQ